MTQESGSKPTQHAGRFAKGQSGNPKGRPRKAAQPNSPTRASAFDIILDRTVPVGQGGETREMTVDEALMLKTYQEALAGGQRARRVILRLIRKRDEAREKLTLSTKGVRPPVEIKMMPVPPRNADEAMLLLGIACTDTKRVAALAHKESEDLGGSPPLLIEPWAVQAALSRRRSSKPLDKKDVAEIIRSTLDPDLLKWPEGSR